MDDVGSALIAQARSFLVEDYLPKIERSLSLLTDEQIWWRANPQSNSIGNLLLHLSGNVRQWIVAGLGGVEDARDRDAEFAQRDVISRGDLLARLRQTLAEADAALAALNPERLLDRFNIQGLEVTALYAMLHVVEHFSMHTGQIIMMTKAMAQTDLRFYDFADGKPLLNWRDER
jgi:uncharacterized damage-inducible protein DinB